MLRFKVHPRVLNRFNTKLEEFGSKSFEELQQLYKSADYQMSKTDRAALFTVLKQREDETNGQSGEPIQEEA